MAIIARINNRLRVMNNFMECCSEDSLGAWDRACLMSYPLWMVHLVGFESRGTPRDSRVLPSGPLRFQTTSPVLLEFEMGPAVLAPAGLIPFGAKGLFLAKADQGELLIR